MNPVAAPERKPIPASLRRYPPGCSDPDFCSGNGICRWDCQGSGDE